MPKNGVEIMKVRGCIDRDVEEFRARETTGARIEKDRRSQNLTECDFLHVIDPSDATVVFQIQTVPYMNLSRVVPPTPNYFVKKPRHTSIIPDENIN